MSTDTPVHPSTAPGARGTHHRTLGPLPRLLVILATMVGLGGSAWTSASANFEFFSELLWPVYIGGAILAWAAKPREENLMRIVGIWITLAGYVGVIVGGAMVGIVAANAPNADSLQTGSGASWFGLGWAVGITSFFLFLIAGITTCIIFGRTRRYWWQER